MATSQSSINPNGNESRERHANRLESAEDLEHRDSREIKRRIDRTRGAMDETLDELGERLSPRNLLDDVVAVFRSPETRSTAKRAGDAAGDFAGNLSRQVRDNPIGATLVGAGLAWLAFGSRHDEADSSRDPLPRRRALQNDYFAAEYEFDDEAAYYTEEDLLLDTQDDVDGDRAELILPETYGESADEPGTMEATKARASRAATSAGDACESAWDSTKSTASSIGETVHDAASSVAGGVKSATSSIGGTMSSTASSTRDTSRRAYRRGQMAARDAARGTRRAGRRSGRYASSTANQAGEQLTRTYDQTARRVRRAHDEAPLALGLGIMALGAVAGALIPRTRREDEWMGEASDDTVRQVSRQAERAYDRGQESLERTVETAKQSAEAQGLTGESLAERAGRVVERAADSIGEAAEQEGLHPRQIKRDAEAVAEETKDQAKSEAEDAKSEAKAEAQKVDPDASKATKS